MQGIIDYFKYLPLEVLFYRVGLFIVVAFVLSVLVHWLLIILKKPLKLMTLGVFFYLPALLILMLTKVTKSVPVLYRGIFQLDKILFDIQPKLNKDSLYRLSMKRGFIAMLVFVTACIWLESNKGMDVLYEIDSKTDQYLGFNVGLSNGLNGLAFGGGSAYDAQNTTSDVQYTNPASELAISSIEVSSALDNGKRLYDATYLYDQDVNTPWIEGKADYGIGSELVVYTGRPVTLTQIDLVNGVTQSEFTYKANARVSQIEILVDGVSQGTYFVDACLPAQYGQVASISVPEIVVNQAFVLRILDVNSEGCDSYKNTGISEISLIGYE